MPFSTTIRDIRRFFGTIAVFFGLESTHSWRIPVGGQVVFFEYYSAQSPFFLDSDRSIRARGHIVSTFASNRASVVARTFDHIGASFAFLRRRRVRSFAPGRFCSRFSYVKFLCAISYLFFLDFFHSASQSACRGGLLIFLKSLKSQKSQKIRIIRKSQETKNHKILQV